MKTFGFNTRMGAITYVIDQSVFLRGVVSSFCIEKLKYLFFLSFGTFIGDTSERYPDTDTSK